MYQESFEQEGYLYLPDFFTKNAIVTVGDILHSFHEKWLRHNKVWYEQSAINSHSITSSDLISAEERMFLFQFIAQPALIQLAKEIFPGKPIFLNTQLFFDPFKDTQPNYWHRDIQYTGMDEAIQQESITTQHVLHFRIPLKPEKGIELIPGTHKTWDLPTELDVRLARNGHKNDEALQRGKTIALDVGDLLIFSANMIHRGLYGKDRLTFDVLFCDDTPAFSNYIDRRNLPTQEELKHLDSYVF